MPDCGIDSGIGWYLCYSSALLVYMYSTKTPKIVLQQNRHADAPMRRQERPTNQTIIMKHTSLQTFNSTRSTPSENRRPALDHLQPLDNDLTPTPLLIPGSDETEIAIAIVVTILAERSSHCKARPPLPSLPYTL